MNLTPGFFELDKQFCKEVGENQQVTRTNVTVCYRQALSMINAANLFVALIDERFYCSGIARAKQRKKTAWKIIVGQLQKWSNLHEELEHLFSYTRKYFL